MRLSTSQVPEEDMGLLEASICMCVYELKMYGPVKMQQYALC